jgi:AcrR family transcriptional regulator
MNVRSPDESDIPSLRLRIRQATAGAILVAAEEVFADQGLHGARMGDIAARAGVAVGTLYNHFEDRDALLAGLLDLRYGELFAELDEGTARGQDFRAQLTLTLQTFVDFFARHKSFYSILMQGEITNHHTNYPVAAKRALEVIAQVHSRVEKLMKRGLRDKALRPELADYYPSLLLGILRGLAIRNLRLGVDGPLADVAQIARFFLEGAGV